MKNAKKSTSTDKKTKLAGNAATRKTAPVTTKRTREQEHKTRARYKLVVLLLAVFLIAIISTVLVYYNTHVQDSLIIPYSFSVEYGVAGLDASTDRLSFGALPPKGWGTRSINLISDEPARIRVAVFGDKSEWIHVQENNFLLEANTNKTLVIFATIPKDATEGTHTGKLRVLFLKP